MACERLEQEILSADNMVSYERDPEDPRKSVSVTHEIPTGIKEKALLYVREFSSNASQTQSIFSGKGGPSDLEWYLSYQGNSVQFVFEIDYGMKYRSYYRSAEEILYGFTILEEFRSSSIEEEPSLYAQEEMAQEEPSMGGR